VQTKFYKDIYGIEPKELILKYDKQAIELIGLSDEKPEWLKNVEKKAVMKTKPPRQPRPDKKPEPIKYESIQLSPMPKPKKTHKPPDELAIKMKEMSLDELINYAKELGVTEDRIVKHKDKPIGLAKMNIGNMIRAYFPNN
jgi:hypothetical protein